LHDEEKQDDLQTICLKKSWTCFLSYWL
jgi:hypothetical protein